MLKCTELQRGGAVAVMAGGKVEKLRTELNKGLRQCGEYKRDKCNAESEGERERSVWLVGWLVTLNGNGK